MSLREPLLYCGQDIGAENLIFESEKGFLIASGGCWLSGIYHTFEAAEQAFQLLDEQLVALHNAADYEIRGITLYEIEQVLNE